MNRCRYISFQTFKCVYDFMTNETIRFYNDMCNCYKTMINRATDFQSSIAKHASSKVILAAT